MILRRQQWTLSVLRMPYYLPSLRLPPGRILETLTKSSTWKQVISVISIVEPSAFLKTKLRPCEPI